MGFDESLRFSRGESQNLWGAAVGSERGEKEKKIRLVLSPVRGYLAWARIPRYFKFQNLDSLAWARFSRSSENITACLGFFPLSDHFLAWARIPEFPKLKHWVFRLGETLSLKRESGSMPHSS
ncbi:hypothetical protein Lal_00042691 [Lupinus albus]|nr:hypothetical protein Lal_00042691 [Lupinus albus]